MLFDGLMYPNIKRKDHSKEEERGINHILITSSLYGAIRLWHVLPTVWTLWQAPMSAIIRKSCGQEAYGQAYLQIRKFCFRSCLINLKMSFHKEVWDKMIRFKFMEEKMENGKIHSTISKRRVANFELFDWIRYTKLSDIKQSSFSGFKFQSFTRKRICFVKKVDGWNFTKKVKLFIIN